MAGPGTAFLTVFTLTVALLMVYYPTGENLTWWVISLTVTTVFVSRFVRTLRRRDGETDRRVCVLVLGDIGRSPRMQYHALSLSKHGYKVTFVGFLDTSPHQDVLREEKIRIVPITEVKGIRVGPRIITYVTKVIIQFLQLLYMLMKMELQSHILMQNPPGLPSIAVTWLVCGLRGSRFVIDWHNYGYTIMALSHGPRHPLVRLAKWYEHIFGPLATHNLCVTNAMKEDLQKNWGIRATTVYDKPASIFRETPVKLRHELFVRLAQTFPDFQHTAFDHLEGKVERTMFSGRDLTDDTVTLRPERPALLLSSTSWTEDEDFSILLKALEGRSFSAGVGLRDHRERSSEGALQEVDRLSSSRTREDLHSLVGSRRLSYFIRLSRPRCLSPQVVQRSGSAHEGGGHVRLLPARLRRPLQLLT